MIPLICFFVCKSAWFICLHTCVCARACAPMCELKCSCGEASSRLSDVFYHPPPDVSDTASLTLRKLSAIFWSKFWSPPGMLHAIRRVEVLFQCFITQEWAWKLESIRV